MSSRPTRALECPNWRRRVRSSFVVSCEFCIEQLMHRERCCSTTRRRGKRERKKRERACVVKERKVKKQKSCELGLSRTTRRDKKKMSPLGSPTHPTKEKPKSSKRSFCQCPFSSRESVVRHKIEGLESAGAPCSLRPLNPARFFLPPSRKTAAEEKESRVPGENERRPAGPYFSSPTKRRGKK